MATNPFFKTPEDLPAYTEDVEVGDEVLFHEGGVTCPGVVVATDRDHHLARKGHPVPEVGTVTLSVHTPDPAHPIRVIRNAQQAVNQWPDERCWVPVRP